MRSQLKTRRAICCLAATLVLAGTSAFAGPRVTRNAASVRAAGTSRPRAIGPISRSSTTRSATVANRHSRSVHRATARHMSTRRPRSVSIRSHGSHHIGHRHHRPRHTAIHVGFGFTSGYVAPPPVTVFEPVYIEPVVVSTPVVMAPPPVVHAPAMQPAVPMSQGVVFEAVVSRDDDIARKEMLTVDGIVLKIEDSDRRPLDVDIDLRVGCRKYEFEDLPIGSRVDIHGRSGQLYHVDILDIDDDTETLRFAISR